MISQTNSLLPIFFVIFIILVIIASVISNDANRRGYNGILWAFIIIMVPMMGIFFYLIFISLNPYNNNKLRTQVNSIN